MIESETWDYVLTAIQNLMAILSNANGDHAARIVAAISGAALFVHFTCKAAFLPNTAPKLIAALVSIISAFSIFTFASAIVGQCLILPLALLVLSVTMFDLSVWACGFKLSEFVNERESNNESSNFNNHATGINDSSCTVLRTRRRDGN